MSTYRAAYLKAKDNGVAVVLTTPENAHLSDCDLMAEARRALAEARLVDYVDDDDIEIGEWEE